MSELTKLRVHVAPIGFEVDRIVLPVEKYRADRVWLIREQNPSKENAGKFIDDVSKKLKKDKIEVKFAECDREDVFDIIKTMKEIFEEEKTNDIYVNVSSGSKIQAIACMMACMTFRECNPTPYYVVPESYPGTQSTEPQTSGMKRSVNLPKYEMKKPEDKIIRALRIIVDSGGKITKKKLAEKTDREKIITVGAADKNYDKVRYGMLDKTIVSPLENIWKFVKIEKIGRNHWIELTPEGENASKFLL